MRLRYTTWRMFVVVVNETKDYMRKIIFYHCIIYQIKL
jgi:hypothetical protein